MTISALTDLERHRERFDPESTRIKRARLRQLARTWLRTAEQVRRLHEVLCFMRAYPDSAEVLEQVVAMLDGFGRRADLRRQRDALEHSGIAGTTIWFPFFYPTARWVEQRWPRLLTLDRTDSIAADSIASVLPALLTPIEAHGLQEAKLTGYEALDRVRGRDTDATFLIRRIANMHADDRVRESFYDLINPSCELACGPDTPSRSRATLKGIKPVWQTAPLRHARPDLAAEIRRVPRALRQTTVAEGRRLIELARESMITRMRDLDAFAYGDPRDVWWIADDGGLAFALIGMQPSRRTAVAATYGGLTLMNGVPIGYHQCDFTGRAAALSFNSFDTFRGTETAHIFARWLAALHHAFGSTSFSIEPYQLGKGNDEGIESGAWWFYVKLGFRPRTAAALTLAKRELALKARSPDHRSRPGTLRALAEHHLFFELDSRRPAPLITPADLGIAAARQLTRLAGSDRSAGVVRARALAIKACGLRSLQGFSSDEREAWDAWAPLLSIMSLALWPKAERFALVRLIRAKAAASERNFVLAFVALPRIEHALYRASRRS